MAVFHVPEGIQVGDFYMNHVPRHFAEVTAGMDLSAMEGKAFTLQFNIDEESYCLKIMNGNDLDIVQGGIERPMLALSLTESDWRDAVTGKLEGLLDTFTDPAQAADLERYNRLLATKGTMKLELKKEDGILMHISLVFNGEQSPEVTIKLGMSDWVAMQKKEVTGQVLFMNGKMQTQGDMMFLVSLQSLL